MHFSEPLKIFIGYDKREAVAYHTCVQSILDNTNVPVSITPLNLKMFKNYKENHSDGSNDFIYTRFLIPYLSNFSGISLFIDGDMIVNDDLSKLISLFDKKYAVQVVKHNYKTKFKTKYLGNKNDDYPRKNWSSVILFNCNHKSNSILTPDFISRSPGSYLHRFSWLKDTEIGELPRKWNHLVHEYDVDRDASINHYTLGTPCFEEFNYGVESKIWHKYFSNSLEGFDYNYNTKKSSSRI